LVGLKLADAATCSGCYCRDHEPIPAPPDEPRLLACGHWGHDGCSHPAHPDAVLKDCETCPDYLFPLLSPLTPVAWVRRGIGLPPRPQQEGWWLWPNVQEAYRLEAQEQIRTAPSYPGGEGRGIVVVGGGKYLVAAYVTIRVLRHVGCRLPVELWHLDGEVDDAMRRLLASYGVECRDADAEARLHPFRFLHGNWWKGWQSKPFAVARSRFREVLMLDADSYPTRDPEYLFDWDDYRRHRAIFWPDLPSSAYMLPPDRWAVFGAPPREPAFESGQLVIDRQECWAELHLALWYNAHADYVYRLLWGDKDTFNVAWSKLGREYAMPRRGCDWSVHTLLQHGPGGEVLFQHRCQDKFLLGPTRFDSSSQRHASNTFNPELVHERACFGFLEELRNTWGTARKPQGPASIEEMYPPVPVSMLVSDEWQRRFREYFLDTGEFECDPFEVSSRTERPQKKCFSVSLFRQSVDNQFPGQFPVDEARWREKYWGGLCSIVGEMNLFPEWKLRIYVEARLGDMAGAAFAGHPRIELYRMRVDSVGANPGTMWRCLALGDRSLDEVFVVDIDESLAYKADYIASFEMDRWSAIARLGGFASAREYLVDPPHSRVKNYATMIGSHVMSRPARWDFDLAAAMRGFMAYRRHMATTGRPWAYAEDDTPNAYNRPIGGHSFGWGSHWFMYCFDERFLKHVVYYHFARMGAIHTWAESIPPLAMSPEGVCDLEHVRIRGNTTVCPHAVVRLTPLGLAPAALRVAFYLAEYRWIFDTLLGLMRRHAASGVCGNLYFHTIDDPYCIDLVPKQINLFEAARHATKAMEIGFNAGHGSAIMLLANPRLTIRAFDTCDLAYVRPCLEFLRAVFGDRIALVEGRSQQTVPADREDRFDLAHIDADHTYDAVVADLANALPRCTRGAVVVLDDHESDNDIGRAARERADLEPTDEYTLRPALRGSSHAIFRYRK
jgi:hypothetical protein